MFTCELEYVYTVECNKVKRLRVEEYRSGSEVFIAVDKGRRIMGSLDCSMFFRTEAEAVAQGFADLQEMLVRSREEYFDALASYKTVRRLSRVTIEEYSLRVLS